MLGKWKILWAKWMIELLVRSFRSLSGLLMINPVLSKEGECWICPLRTNLCHPSDNPTSQPWRKHTSRNFLQITTTSTNLQSRIFLVQIIHSNQPFKTKIDTQLKDQGHCQSRYRDWRRFNYLDNFLPKDWDPQDHRNLQGHLLVPDRN